MQFKSLKNIETSFRQIRLFTLVFLGLCAVVAIFSVVKSYQFAERQREKIYVLDQGKSLMLALSQDLQQNRPVEAREHVRRFHELFFTLAPDRAAIESNINRAMFLCDKSAYHYSQDLQEKGYYNRIVAGNINQTVQVDSMSCDFNTYPYPYLVSFWGEQVKRNTLFIACPEEQLKVKELIITTRAVDPIVFQISPYGIVIHSMWGEESEDKIFEEYKKINNLLSI